MADTVELTEKEKCNDKAPLITSATFHYGTPDEMSVSFEYSKENSKTHMLSTSGRKLRKNIGCLQGFSLLVGILIGSGVFISPAFVTKDTKDAGMSLVVWISCGLIALGGSLCYVELGCALKRNGGKYVYIREAYGSFPAFLCSWTLGLLVHPSALAIITLTLGTYVMKPFDAFITPSPWYPKLIALIIILIMVSVNCWSVKAATRAQTFFAACQVLAVTFVVVVGIWQFAKRGTQHVFNGMFKNVGGFTVKEAGAFGAAIYSGLWAFDGWGLAVNITEEMTNLERNLFLSIITGIPFVIFCYVLVNFSLLSALTVEQISASPAVAVTFIHETLGQHASFVMPILVALSCYGAASGVLFAGGRLPLAAGREGHLPEVLSMIHKDRRTPIPSIIFLSSISILMLLPDASALETLISFFNVSYWLIYGLSFSAVITLRIRRPELERPYKVWLTTPVLMMLVSLVLVILPFFDNPVNPLIAMGIIAMGIPFYFMFVHFEPRHPDFLVNFRSMLKRKAGSYNLVPCEM